MSSSKTWTLRVSGIPRADLSTIRVELKSILKDSFANFNDNSISSIDILPACKRKSELIALIDLEGHIPATISQIVYTKLLGRPVTIDSDFLGLTQLYETVPDRSISADVIAITGLGGHAYTSWKGKNNPHLMWLRHALGTELPRCRTMTYGYESRLSALGISRIQEYARGFRNEVEKVRRTAEEIERPLIIVGHSYGGLVVAHSIIESYVEGVDQNDPASSALYRACYGFVFFAVPHRGMIVKDMAQSIGEDHPRISLLNQIQYNPMQAPDLLESNLERFRELIRHRKVVTVYEQLLTQGLERQDDGKSLQRTGENMMLMSPESAIMGLINQSEKKVPSMRDHSEVAKFDSMQDTVLETILNCLQKFEEQGPDIVKNQFHPYEKRSDRQKQHEDTIKDVLCWLSPQDHDNDHYREELQNARSLRHPGSCRWILARREFQGWLNSHPNTQDSLLWIVAIPGAGKTVLSSYLIEEALANALGNSSEILYFFFKGTDKDKDSPLAAVKALIHQLLQSDTEMEVLTEVECCMKTSSHPRAFKFAPLWDLFCLCLSRRPGCCILLDALDECENPGLLLPGLLDLSRKHSVRVILTGREQELTSETKGLPVMRISERDLVVDIESYTTYQVSQSSTLSHARVRSRIIRILTARSKEMFLWVALMIKELGSLSSVDEVEEALSSIPEDLSGVYERILKRLRSNLKPSKRKLCIRLLRWIVLAKRPLHLKELEVALRLDYSMAQEGFYFPQNLLRSAAELENICGSLITSKNGTIQLIHFSTKEFLLSPTHTSSLEESLRDFSFSVLKDNAYLAERLLFLVADSWKSTSVFFLVDKYGESNDKEPVFLDYAFLNWVSHLAESSPQEVARYVESMKGFFHSHQSWWTWICHCLCLRRTYLGQLNIDVQSLLGWSEAHEDKTSTDQSWDAFGLVIKRWAESILLILEDYGLALQNEPQLIWQIDPCSVDLPLITKEVAMRGQPIADFERHIVFRSPKASSPPPRSTLKRQLPRNTSHHDDYGFFLFDRRRKVFFFTDKYLNGNGISFYFQEAETDRRGPPIIDTELQDDTSKNLRVAEAVLSPDSRYLAMVYAGDFLGSQSSFEDGINAQQDFYTVVWLLQEDLGLINASSPPWAKKITSLTTTRDRLTEYSNLVAFTTNNVLCCPNGHLDLLTGEETGHPDPPNWELIEGTVYDFTFSTWSQKAFFRANTLDSFFIQISPNGSFREIARMEHTFSAQLRSISPSGRFLIWRQTCEQFSYQYKYCIHDTTCNKTRDLEATNLPSLSLEGNYEFFFTRGESELLGIVTMEDSDDEMTNANMILWTIEEDQCSVHGARVLRRGILGCSIDELEGVVYVVDRRRVWNCYDLKTQDMCSLYSEAEERSVDRIEHLVSQKGDRIGLLRVEHHSVAIKIFELDRGGNTLIDRPLDIPEGDYVNVLTVCSPNLEFLFIGNIVMGTGLAHTNFLPFPAHSLPQEATNGLDRRDGWECKFSACSEYFALFLDPMGSKKRIAQLHVFHISTSGDTVEKITFLGMDMAAHERLGVSFHPQQSHILLMSSQRLIPRFQGETTCHILDLKTGAIARLGSRQHPRRCTSHSKFSACGTYIVKRHDIVELFWRVPTETFGTPLAQKFTTVTAGDGILYWSSCQMRLEIRSPYVYLNLLFSTEQGWQEEILTAVPKRLERWTTTLVVGEDWSSRKLRVVFVDDGGSAGGDCHAGRARAEMKELLIDFTTFLDRFPEWRQEGMRARSLSVTSEDDEDDEDEDSKGSW